MNKYSLALFFIIPLLLNCNTPVKRQAVSQVTVNIVSATDEIFSRYLLTVTGSDMDTIGPLVSTAEFLNYVDLPVPEGNAKRLGTMNHTVMVVVPDGKSRKFYCERYNNLQTNNALLDTGTADVDIGPGMNTVTVTLIAAMIRDTIPPVITILGGDTVSIIKGDPNNLVAHYLDQITVTDAGGGPTTILEPRSTVNVFQVNPDTAYKIIYSAQDSSRNRATATRYVFIVQSHPPVDTTAPVLVIGDTIVYVPVGEVYVDQTVSAFDVIDGPIARERIVSSGTVNTAVSGMYSLTYNVTDNMGNTATATRTVIVMASCCIDTVPPVITLLGDDTVRVTMDMKMPDFMKAYSDPGYSAFDDRDGDITSNVTVSPLTQLNGRYWCFTYSVSDAEGNTATIKRIIDCGSGGDPVPPVIDLVYPDSIIQHYPGAPWREPGYTAADLVDGDITNKVIVDTFDLVTHISTPGTYSITYTVTNSSGYIQQKTRIVQVLKVIVEPPEPPIILLKGKNPDTVLVKSAASYTDPGATALDNKDGDLTAKITRTGKVDMNTPGKYTLNYSVSSAAGNVGRATRVVWVVRDTIYSNLFDRYGVPSEKPLPDMENKTYMKFTIDGNGPDLSSILKWSFSWSLTNSSLYNFELFYSVEPWHWSIEQASYSFASENPSMRLFGTGIQGLDGQYYVAVRGSEFFWVEKEGKFAIIWSE